MSAARPLVVTITDLLRRPGVRRDLQRSVDLGPLGITTARVPDGGEVELDLTLEAVAGGLTATGTIAVPWVGECRRCLHEVRGRTDAHVQEVFERHPTEGETYPLGDDQVDLEPMVRDAVLLALPLAPLCSEDCRGPAPDAFPATVEADPPAGGGGDEPATPGDPRWSALDQLRFEEGDASDGGDDVGQVG